MNSSISMFSVMACGSTAGAMLAGRSLTEGLTTAAVNIGVVCLANKIDGIRKKCNPMTSALNVFFLSTIGATVITTTVTYCIDHYLEMNASIGAALLNTAASVTGATTGLFVVAKIIETVEEKKDAIEQRGYDRALMEHHPEQYELEQENSRISAKFWKSKMSEIDE